MTEILPGIPIENCPFQYYRNHLAQDGDLLLWKPTTLFSRLIAVLTDGPFGHVSTAWKWTVNGDYVWMQCGFEAGRHGAVVEPLELAVAKYPGMISVFRADVAFDHDAVKLATLRGLTGNYEWDNIILFAMRFIPVVRLLWRSRFFRRLVKSEASDKTGSICSRFVAQSFADDEVHFVQKHHSEVTPNDIALSSITRYVVTLI